MIKTFHSPGVSTGSVTLEREKPKKKTNFFLLNIYSNIDVHYDYPFTDLMRCMKIALAFDRQSGHLR